MVQSKMNLLTGYAPLTHTVLSLYRRGACGRYVKAGNWRGNGDNRESDTGKCRGDEILVLHRLWMIIQKKIGVRRFFERLQRSSGSNTANILLTDAHIISIPGHNSRLIVVA